mmetsp:Transcript_3069/g.4397  ORF Transcript_3069/g.4397 Transcript_3069/m.4397 type:complete len:114 (-) Transcript_3069:269-610(-)
MSFFIFRLLENCLAFHGSEILQALIPCDDYQRPSPLNIFCHLVNNYCRQMANSRITAAMAPGPSPPRDVSQASPAERSVQLRGCLSPDKVEIRLCMIVNVCLNGFDVFVLRFY